MKLQTTFLTFVKATKNKKNRTLSRPLHKRPDKELRGLELFVFLFFNSTLVEFRSELAAIEKLNNYLSR